MSKKITFRMHAYSDAAGKYNPDATRDGNEDNFYVDDNLCDEYPSHCESDVAKELCDLGLIMAVADGMGGMNAGEVASEIAVETIQEFFSPGKVTEDNAKDHQSRKKYLERLIVEADARIKNDSKNNPGHEGMGSTIILAWIVGDQLTLSWCGDSRAYRYNPAFGIELISEDHSYVQELVKQGMLTYDQTFEHPQGNIITRSLGDETKKAQPETRFFDVYNNDIILLCSDGLSGVLRDRKTPDGEGGYFPGDNLEDIIRVNSQSLVECREALWKAAENADWYDNVTAILCEIKSGAADAPARKIDKPEESVNINNAPDNRPWWMKSVIKLSPKSLFLIVITIILAIAACFGGYKGYKFVKEKFDKQVVDSLTAVVPPVNEVHEDDKVVTDKPTEEKIDAPVAKPTTDNVPGTSTSKPKDKVQKDLIGKAESILESSQAPSSDKEAGAELNLISEELTKAKESTYEATKTQPETAELERFLLKEVKMKQGDTQYGFVQKFTGRVYHKLFIFDNDFEPVPSNSLKAEKTYTLLLLSNCKNPDDLLLLYKTVGNTLCTDKDVEVPLENIQTIKEFLKAINKEQTYKITRVEKNN